MNVIMTPAQLRHAAGTCGDSDTANALRWIAFAGDRGRAVTVQPLGYCGKLKEWVFEWATVPPQHREHREAQISYELPPACPCRCNQQLIDIIGNLVAVNRELATRLEQR